MKRFAILLIVILLTGMASAAQAVVLQQGWYAAFDYVHLYGYDGPHDWLTYWFPSSNIGQVGPVLIEGQGPNGKYGRKITITQSATVDPGVLFEDYGIYSNAGPYYNEARIGLWTDYDADRIQLQVFRHRDGAQDELVWKQDKSGYIAIGNTVWNSSPLYVGEELVIRLVAVPEPASIIIFGTGTVIAFLRRRQVK